jgi:hypothetical protein
MGRCSFVLHCAFRSTGVDSQRSAFWKRFLHVWLPLPHHRQLSGVCAKQLTKMCQCSLGSLQSSQRAGGTQQLAQRWVQSRANVRLPFDALRVMLYMLVGRVYRSNAQLPVPRCAGSSDAPCTSDLCRETLELLRTSVTNLRCSYHLSDSMRSYSRPCIGETKLTV